MSECETCAGTGIETKQTWEQPAEGCEDCLSTGDGRVANCISLIADVERLIGDSNPKLSREVVDALQERIEELT